MHLPIVLDKGFKLLPPLFRNAYKKSKLELRYLLGERDLFSFSVNGVNLVFNIYYAHQIGHLQLHYIKREAQDAFKQDQLPTLVVSPVIYPRIAEKLLEMDVSYMDAVGNVYINQQTIYILNTKKKSDAATKPTKSRLFGETGIKLLFALLQDPEAIDIPYRELAKLVEISPASITILFREMMQSEYLFEGIEGDKRLLRKRELLQRWVTAYHEVLRPKLLIGKYQSFKKELVRNFRSYPVEEWNGNWSGESAAAVYTGYLKPEILTMYVPGEGKPWMKQLALIPVDSNPEIEVLKYFWDQNHPLFRIKHGVTPPLLVYAELAGSSDSRNQETAQRIYDEYLQFIEQ